MKCPRPRVRHVIRAIEPATKEVPCVADLGAAVDLVACARSPAGSALRLERPQVGLDELLTIVAGRVGALDEVRHRELERLPHSLRIPPWLHAHDVADVAPKVRHGEDVLIAALSVVRAVLSIVDSWLGQESDLSRDEVVSWSTTAAVAIIEAVTARER
jgi:hypothetical protein